MHGRNVETCIGPAQHHLATVSAIVNEGGAATTNHDDKLVLVPMSMYAPARAFWNVVYDEHAADWERNVITFLRDRDASVVFGS